MLEYCFSICVIVCLSEHSNWSCDVTCGLTPLRWYYILYIYKLQHLNLKQKTTWKMALMLFQSFPYLHDMVKSIARSSYDWNCVPLCPLWNSIWSSTMLKDAGLLSSSTYTLTTYVKVPFMPWMAGKEKRNEIVDFGWMLCVCLWVCIWGWSVFLLSSSNTWFMDMMGKAWKNISSFTALVLRWCNLRSFSQIDRQEKDEIVALGHSMLQLIEGAVNLDSASSVAVN